MKIENKVYIVDGQVTESAIKDGFTEAVQLAQIGEVTGFRAEGSNGTRYGYDTVVQKHYVLTSDSQDMTMYYEPLSAPTANETSADEATLKARILELENENGNLKQYSEIFAAVEKRIATRTAEQDAKISALESKIDDVYKVLGK